MLLEKLTRPLKENEKLHISEHRSSKIETKSSTKASVEQPEKLGKKKKDLNKKSSEETKKKKKKEKESTKTDLLTIEDDTQHNHTNEYNELLSPDQENLTIIHNLPSSKKTIVSNSTDSKMVLTKPVAIKMNSVEQFIFLLTISSIFKYLLRFLSCGYKIENQFI